MRNMHDEFKKLNAEFKKTIAEMNASLTEDVDKLKDRLATEKVRQSLQPFLLFAYDIKDLSPDTVITDSGNHVITAMDFLILVEAINS